MTHHLHPPTITMRRQYAVVCSSGGDDDDGDDDDVRATKGERCSQSLVAPFGGDDIHRARESLRVSRGLRSKLTNTVGMKLNLIPPGEFWMGASSAQSQCEDELPHHVRITRPFFLGATVVTQRQWQRVMGTEPWKDGDSVECGPEYPATCVSWKYASEFCRQLSRREGRHYRLPMEAEWEFACRSGTQSHFWFGPSPDIAERAGWFESNTTGVGQPHAHLVAQKRQNGFGLFDMHGDVAEWCFDWYGEDYAELPAKNPSGPTEGSSRVVRGGSWWHTAVNSRSAARYHALPAYCFDAVGFRVALSPVKPWFLVRIGT